MPEKLKQTKPRINFGTPGNKDTEIYLLTRVSEDTKTREGIIRSLVAEGSLACGERVIGLTMYDQTMAAIGRHSKTESELHFFDWQIIELDEAISKKNYIEISGTKYPIRNQSSGKPITRFRNEMNLTEEFSDAITKYHKDLTQNQIIQNISRQYATQLSVEKGIDFIRFLSEKTVLYDKKNEPILARTVKKHIQAAFKILLKGHFSDDSTALRDAIRGKFESPIFRKIERDIDFWPSQFDKLFPDHYQKLKENFRFEFDEEIKTLNIELSADIVFDFYEEKIPAFFYHIFQISKLWNDPGAWWYWETYTHMKSIILLIEACSKQTATDKSLNQIIQDLAKTCYKIEDIGEKSTFETKNYAEFTKKYTDLLNQNCDHKHLLIYKLSRNFFAHVDNMNYDDFLQDKIRNLSFSMVRVLIDSYCCAPSS